jgi:dTDP-glucose 4,6-dehydratase
MTALLSMFEPDAVVHLAREGHANELSTGSYIKTNVVGTFGLIEATRDYWAALAGPRRDRFRFVHVSSADVFGSQDRDAAPTDNNGYAPATSFAGSMAAADQLVIASCRGFGLPAIIAAPTDAYGPYQGLHQPLPAMIIDAIEGRMPHGADSATQVERDFIYVGDCVSAIEAMLLKGAPGQIYHFGSGSRRSMAYLAQKIAQLVERHGGKTDITATLVTPAVPVGQDADKQVAAANEKLKSDTGWRPAETIDTGLSKSVRWYLDNEGWWRSIVDARDEGFRQGLLLRA